MESGLVAVGDEISDGAADFLATPGLQTESGIRVVTFDGLGERDGSDPDQRFSLNPERQLAGHPVRRGGHYFKLVVDGGGWHGGDFVPAGVRDASTSPDIVWRQMKDSQSAEKVPFGRTGVGFWCGPVRKTGFG